MITVSCEWRSGLLGGHGNVAPNPRSAAYCQGWPCHRARLDPARRSPHAETEALLQAGKKPPALISSSRSNPVPMEKPCLVRRR